VKQIPTDESPGLDPQMIAKVRRTNALCAASLVMPRVFEGVEGSRRWKSGHANLSWGTNPDEMGEAEDLAKMWCGGNTGKLVAHFHDESTARLDQEIQDIRNDDDWTHGPVVYKYAMDLSGEANPAQMVFASYMTLKLPGYKARIAFMGESFNTEAASRDPHTPDTKRLSSVGLDKNSAKALHAHTKPHLTPWVGVAGERWYSHGRIQAVAAAFLIAFIPEEEDDTFSEDVLYLLAPLNARVSCPLLTNKRSLGIRPDLYVKGHQEPPRFGLLPHVSMATSVYLTAVNLLPEFEKNKEGETGIKVPPDVVVLTGPAAKDHPALGGAILTYFGELMASPDAGKVVDLIPDSILSSLSQDTYTH